jgi:23S rRNA (adenine2503-C2)-methyltransferase
MIKIASITYNEFLSEMIKVYGKGDFFASAVYKKIFRYGKKNFHEMEQFLKSPELAEKLYNDIVFDIPDVSIVCKNETIKFITRLQDGNIIESVIIPSEERTTLCVSSQAGCRWNCVFCATGAKGFARDLSVEEITGQLFSARFVIKQDITNVVFMGMGEPLDNFDNVIHSIKIMSDPHGFNIALRRITVSTAGHADGIKRLRESGFTNLHLAVSVNAPVNDLRSTLMPINRTYPLDRLKYELKHYNRSRRNVFFIEYVLIAGLNDSREMAGLLSAYLRDLPVRVNVIACNDGISEFYMAPDMDHIKKFCAWLEEENVFVRIRKSYGSEIKAGCGQLGAVV